MPAHRDVGHFVSEDKEHLQTKSFARSGPDTLSSKNNCRANFDSIVNRTQMDNILSIDVTIKFLFDLVHFSVLTAFPS